MILAGAEVPALLVDSRHRIGTGVVILAGAEAPALPARRLPRLATVGVVILAGAEAPALPAGSR